MECESFNKRYCILKIIIQTNYIQTNFKQNNFFNNLENNENGLRSSGSEKDVTYSLYIQTNSCTGKAEVIGCYAIYINKMHME